MKSIIAAAILATFAAASQAAPVSYNVDPSHTYATFQVSHLGFSNQSGGFEKISGSVIYDAAAKTGNADITIDVNSLHSGWAARDKHLLSEDFFNAAKFPTITFKGKDFKFNGDKLESVTGDFTLLGVTKPVTLAVSNFNCAPHPMSKKPACGANAVATIKRSDFGMNTFVPAVSDEVKLNIVIEAAAQ